MVTIPDLAFITCIEEGYLEAQSLLLYESIRDRTGRFRHCPIYAISPRVGHGISLQTQRRLDQLGVEYLNLELNQDNYTYPLGNKTFASAYVEANRSHSILVFLDSDTLFFHEPIQLDLLDSCDVAVRPVSWKTICTSGSTQDPNDLYWRKLCEFSRVDYDSIPLIKTAVGCTQIKSCYNAGLVAVRAKKGIFTKWLQDYMAALDRGLVPENGKVWGSDQSTLSTAIWGSTDRVKILEPSYNYPIRSIKEQQPLLQFSSSRELVHIHYHRMFNREMQSLNPILQPGFELEDELKEWLLSRLPLD